jgi:hypothetical protein
MLPDKFGALVAGVVFGEPQFVIYPGALKRKAIVCMPQCARFMKLV